MRHSSNPERAAQSTAIAKISVFKPAPDWEKYSISPIPAPREQATRKLMIRAIQKPFVKKGSFFC